MYGRRKIYILSACAVAGFMYGFNYEIVNNYFNTPKSVIGLLLTTITLLWFWIIKLIDKLATVRNSLSYQEGKTSELKQEICWYKEQIKNKDEYQKELIEKLNDK